MATPQRSHATPEFRHLRQGRVLLSAGPPDMIGAGPENGGSTMHALCRMAAVCLAVLPLCALAEGGGYWPEGRKAAVSLAYDDALDSQLDNAVPALARHGFKATFYVPPGQGTLDARLDEWRAVAQAGHELGNHSLFHQCEGTRPGRDWVVPHRDLHTTTVAQMHDQIQVANTFLRALDGRSERSFTSPAETAWPPTVITCRRCGTCSWRSRSARARTRRPPWPISTGSRCRSSRRKV